MPLTLRLQPLDNSETPPGPWHCALTEDVCEHSGPAAQTLAYLSAIGVHDLNTDIVLGNRDKTWSAETRMQRLVA